MAIRLSVILALATSVPAPTDAQPPVSALSLPRLLARIDTVEAYSRQGVGAPVRTGYYERTVSTAADGGWIVERRWHDTTGAWITTQRTTTSPGSIATQLERVRGLVDSASLLVGERFATGWIVPRGQLPTVIEAELEQRFADADVAVLAVAASRPQPGTVFLVPHIQLFSADPTAVRTDTLRALAPARIRMNGRDIETQTLAGTRGRTYWVERATGRLLATRTTVGSLTTWQAVSGITPPEF